MPDVLDWIYNSRTGIVVDLPKPAAFIELKSGLGWHGPFDSKEAAVKYYNDNKAKNPGWKEPTTNIGTALGNAPSAINDQIQGGLGLSDENIRTWMIRIGEILLGIVLVGVGVAKLTGTTNVIAKAVKAKI